MDVKRNMFEHHKIMHSLIKPICKPTDLNSYHLGFPGDTDGAEDLQSGRIGVLFDHFNLSRYQSEVELQLAKRAREGCGYNLSHNGSR